MIRAQTWLRAGVLMAASLMAFVRLSAAEIAANGESGVYLLISPPEFYEDWRWYIGERKKVHPELTFAVKNTAEIYREHPFGEGLDCRNAAESIHAYLRSQVAGGLRYVVLGGAWLDAQNRLGYTPYFASGEMMSLSNCVPGVYGYPREDWRNIPADYFYACLDLVNGQRYPWDANCNGKYIDQNDCANNDLYPDVIVSRITLNPYTGQSGKVYNQHALITNYVAKLKRGEAKDFAGHYRYGMSAASTGSSRLRKNVDRMYYRELEFYDNMRNMFDPNHHDTIEDDEYSTRVRYYNQYSMWRPIREVKGMMSYTWTATQPNLSQAMDDYYASDRDFGFVQAHGWAQGAACFSASRFATAKGLTLFNGGSGPCETGYPDYHVQSGDKRILQYNVGDAAVTNPDGGALASVNNSRWSWAGGGGYGAMSYYMLNEMLIGFNQDRVNVGRAWMRGCTNYWPVSHSGGTHTWCLTEQFLYGDPLVQLPEVPNVWWKGGETGVWDRVTANWTNSVDDAATFDAANNVYFDIATNLELDVAGEIAAMRLSLPVHAEDAVITLAGTGTLRVMQAVDIAATNSTLVFDVAGGVGHNGIRFLTGAGSLVFEGTNKFYVGGVTNASQIALLGGGVTLDVDEFASGSFPLWFDGSSAASPLPANELRSAKVGGLARFGSLAITNSHVKLSTVDAFGRGQPITHTLVNSKLEIAANVYYQVSGYPEGLNATFLVDGDSSVTSSLGGVWTVKHETTYALGRGARLTLGAETVNGNGRIVITNRFDDASCTNTVEIANAAALAGDVVIGKGIRLVLRELPLSAVTSLTIGEGATIELPNDDSGYWQLIPVSSKFTCANGVIFTTASNPTAKLDGSPSPTGSFFKEGAIYRWTGEEGEWNRYFANRHPKIIFGDLAANDVTVRVATAVSPEFAFFSNLRTKYTYEAAAEDASVFFAGVYFCGPTEFRVPVSATEYVEISTATSRFSCVQSPYVHVAAGAGLALAGSHWTDLRLDAGAVLVAVSDCQLDWNAETTITFPEEGAVLIDVGALELGSEPIRLIAGVGHTWSLADLKRFKLVQPDAELRIVDGALAVVKGENQKGPYNLTVEGAANWNTRSWKATSNDFANIWSECALDWSADVSIVVRANPESQIARHELTVDCDVHASTLLINASTNDFRLCGSESFSSIDVVTLDLSECHAQTEVDIDTRGAAILTSTNESAIVRLRRAGSGVITLSGSTVVLEHPGDWSLTLGAQGTLRVVAPQAYERFKIAKVQSGFELGGLEVKVTDSNDAVINGFSVVVADGAIWCIPPALQAVVPSGTNELTQLEWRDVLGNVVSNVEWDVAAGFTLIGEKTSGVVIAKRGFESVWNRLSVSNEVVIYGNETLSPSQIPGGNGILALAGGFTVKADVNANQNLLSGAKLKFHEGTTLEIRHCNMNFDARWQNWSGITGNGRVYFADGVGSWIALPSNMFADTLSVESDSDIVLTEGFGTAHQLAISNLSGAGRFRSDWGSGDNMRPVRTTQTKVSAFSGYFHKKDGRTAKLIVTSDDEIASTNKALVINGAAIEEHTLDIETNGCVILTGSWNGPINVAGLLVITNACATNGLTVTTSGKGEVKLVDANELPEVTLSPEYIAPEYPADPITPDSPAETDDCVRILYASVGSSNDNWSRLAWYGTNGVMATSIDWSVVTNVTLTATKGTPRIIFDATDFVGVAHLMGGVIVEARSLKPFVLSETSEGAVDFRLDPVPTATVDMLQVAAGTNTPENVAVSVHDRYGREIEVAGEVTYDAANRKYYLNVQNVGRPWVSNTFDTQYDDTLSSSLGFSGSGGLTYKDWPAYFESSRSGRALIGYSKEKFTLHSHNGNPTVSMDNVYSWSINFVVKLPTNDGGIIFGWGNKDSGNGVALVRVRENVAGVYAWKDGGRSELVASANVQFGSTQFHSYAIVHDSHTLKFYVDGGLAQSVALEGKYPTRGFYQYFKMYGQNGQLSDGPSAVVDDFRLYNYCLTPASVRVIANGFEPWPEYPSAHVDVDGLAWSNLYWSAECDADDSLTLVADGGSLKIDAPIALGDSLSVIGGRVPIKFADDGALIVQRGISAVSTLELDASALDGAALAANAVIGAPYSRWLVRGALAGDVVVLPDLPEMPHGYSIESVVDAYGARLVVTAPWFAKYGSLNFNFAGNTDKSVNSSATRVSDNASYNALKHGAHPVVGSEWCDLAAQNGATTKGDVTIMVSQVANAYGTGKAVGDQILYGYADDSKSPMVVVSNIPYAAFRVITYHATDNANTVFCPVWIGSTAADAMRYFGPTRNSSTGGYTASGMNDVTWGDSDCRSALVEGVNYVISGVITGEVGKATAYISIPKLTSGRACLAAFQIVEVGAVVDSQAVDYRATVTNDTNWADGEGKGLNRTIVYGDGWQNDTNSRLTLVAPTSGCPTLTFDTALTAGVLRVVSGVAERLALEWDGAAALAIGALDLADAAGVTVFPDAWFATIPLTSAAGARIRIEQSVTVPLFTSPGLTVAYPQATFTAKPSVEDWVLRTELPDDRATLAYNDPSYLALDVDGGEITFGKSGCNQLIYGGVKSTGTNSVITVDGGHFTCPVGGDGSNANSRGMILGNTGSANINPRIIVNDGLCEFPNGIVTIWQKAGIIVNGGVLRTRGIWKGSDSAGVLALNGGVLELGRHGIAKYAADCKGALTATLAGGTIHAVETATVTLPVTLTKSSAVAATNDTTLTFSAAVTGGGGLTIGGDGEWRGSVVFSDAATRLGNVTLSAGVSVSVPIAALSGDLTVGEGATLNLLQTSSFPAVTNRVCAGQLTLPESAVILINGEPLTENCRLENGELIVNAASRTWANPVTGESLAFAYRFTGGQSGDWQTVANWQKFGLYDWQPLTGDKVPMLPNHGLWEPTVIDGDCITNAANRAVTLAVDMEGWQPRLAVFNGATVTVSRIRKFQSEGCEKFLWVDATSKLKFNALGDASYNDAVKVCVAASNGVTFATEPGNTGAIFKYYLKGVGSVEHLAPLTKCAYQICRADIQLSAAGLAKVIREKRLVSLASGENVAFTSAGATIVAEDPAGEIAAGALQESISAADDIGACAITQRVDGVWLEYVDRADGESAFVHEVEQTNGVLSVEIPYEWLMKLTNGNERLLEPRELTAGKVAAALNSKAAPNGVQPWQSYLLGLEPTNALDDVHCELAIGADGKLTVHLPNIDPSRQPNAAAIRYILQTKAALTDEWIDHSENTEPTAEVEATSAPAAFFRYRIEFK